MARAVQRTDWAEEFVARFLAMPLVINTVMLRPQWRDGSRGDRGVCDVLFVHRRAAVVVSMKTQADPTARTGEDLKAWCSKHSRRAARSLHGAIGTLGTTRISSLHPLRGRVECEPGELEVRHAVAAIETREPIPLPADLPDRMVAPR